jgi:putative copper resistance protein D
MDTCCSSTTVWFAVARAVHFGTCLLLFSVVGFDRFIARGLGGRAWDSSVRWLIWLALPAALLSGGAWLAFTAIAMSGLPARQALQLEILRLVWNQTHFGFLWHLRLLCWLAVAVALFLRQWPSLRAAGTWAALVGAALLLLSLAWAGHGQIGPHAHWHLLADSLHLLAAGFWPAGLLPFALLLYRLRRQEAAEKWNRILTITRRFSAMSVASVAILAATGLINSWFMVGSVKNLWLTEYGKVLSIKIVCFVIMAGIGAINLLRLKPRLGVDAEGPGVAARMQRNVVGELVLAGVIIAVVGVLGLLPPAMPCG